MTTANPSYDARNAVNTLGDLHAQLAAELKRLRRQERAMGRNYSPERSYLQSRKYQHASTLFAALGLAFDLAEIVADDSPQARVIASQ